MNDVRTRSATADDYGAVASVLNRIDAGDRKSAAELRAQDEATRASGLVCERLLATVDAEPVGYGVYGELDWCADPGVWSCGVYVVPEQRRRAIGATLHERIVATARAAGIERLFGQAADRDGAGPAFAAALGYRLVGTDFESWIDLEDRHSVASAALRLGLPVSRS